MKKIKSLFKRNYGEGQRLVYNEVVEGSEWVLNDEGVPTRKYDGTCCAIINGELYKRYDAKAGKKAPEGAIPCQEPDPITGHHPHWVKCVESKPEDKYFFEGLRTFAKEVNGEIWDGTFELCGEKINGNPEHITGHTLIPHGQTILLDVPLTFEGLKEYLKDKDIEGIVWHRKDGSGDMVKIKKKDFWGKR